MIWKFKELTDYKVNLFQIYEIHYEQFKFLSIKNAHNGYYEAINSVKCVNQRIRY